MLHISGIILMVFIYDTHVWNDNTSRRFFHVLKMLIFWVVREVKVQKVDWNDKKFCQLCSIFQEPYIICLSFVVHKCKLIISPGFFFVFLRFWFFVLLGGSKGKNDPKWQTMSFALYISGTIHHTILICGTHV